MIKYTAAAGWTFASCFYLWFFAISSTLPPSTGPLSYSVSGGHLFLSYLVFTIILTLGGGSYYVMTKIIETPYRQADKGNWGSLCFWLLAALVAPITTIVTVNYLHDVYGSLNGYIIFVVSITVSWFLSICMMGKAVKKMRSLQILGELKK